MNSIPLTAPDGTVYAYACGECQQVHIGYRSAVKARSEASKETADACCLCLDCKVVKVNNYGSLCADCHQKRRDAEAAAQLKRVEKSLNPEAALELLKVMQGYCQDTYDSDWLEDIEFDLHSSTEAVLSSGSQGHYTQKHLDSLRTVAGGWWTRSDSDDEARFVTTAEWLDLVAARQRHNGS